MRRNEFPKLLPDRVRAVVNPYARTRARSLGKSNLSQLFHTRGQLGEYNPMTFKPWHGSSHLYFITGTLLGWRPLFVRRAFALIVMNSLDWHHREKRFALYAYVVMPTHFHAIIKPAESQTISANLQSFGSFTAHAILKQLRLMGLSEELHFFSENRQPDHTEKHQIWQPIEAKNIYTPEFLREKVEYIHNNPVAKRWQLAPHRAAYEFSSARFYDCGEAPVVAVDDVREWLI